MNSHLKFEICLGLSAVLCMISCLHSMDIVKDSKPVARIFVDPEDMADAPTKTIAKPAARQNAKQKPKPANPGIVALAVDDLNYHIEKMSGTKLEVVITADQAQVSGPAVVIGKLAGKLSCEVPQSKWKEGYRILVKGDMILISGESMKGTSHGIYAFLRLLGCDWVMPGKLGEIIPVKNSISLGQTDQKSSPDFGVRSFWYRGGPDIVSKEEREEYAQWTRRQCLGKADEFADDKGGHFWGQLVSEYKKEFEADPEMLALVRQPDGTLVRKGPQVETTSPKVIRLMADSIRKTFEKNGWPKDKAVNLPIGPADGDGYSISPESIAIGTHQRDPMAGGEDYTELVVKLANDVMGQLRDEFPNLSLGYLVYSVHSGFPAVNRPDPKIYPTFAPINFSRLHSTEDPHSKSRTYYRGLVEKWADLSKKHGNMLQVYEYNWNLTDNMLPFTRIKMFGEDIHFYHKMGFAGFTLESTKAWALNGPHDYVAARMCWDSSQDWKKLLWEYCAKSFGAAAPMMERYYLRLAELQSCSGQEAGSYFSAPLIFNDAYVIAARKNLDEALTQKLEPDQRIRTEAASSGLDILQLYLDWHRTMGSFEFTKAGELLNAISSTWQKQLDRDPQLVAREAPKYARMFLQGTTDASIKYSSAPYEIVWKFPEELPTALDPDSTGDKRGFAATCAGGRIREMIQESDEEAVKYSSAPYDVVFRFPENVRTAIDPLAQGEKMNLQSPEINDDGWMRTRISPEGWNRQGLGSYREGAAWYRVRFDLPKAAEKRSTGLFIGAFDNEARVWVNGKYVGTTGIKFAKPAVLDISEAVREGGNLVAVQVVHNAGPEREFVGGIFSKCFVFSGPAVKQDVKNESTIQKNSKAEKEQLAVSSASPCLASPELDESGWIRTHTWSSSWDAQGLGFYRDGSVWYRVRFSVPNNAKAESYGLFLGGFEDEARIWLNGTYIGSSGIKFSKASVLDISSAVRRDGENAMAIQIVRNSRLNEIFIGGIFRPCFIFVGPRVMPAEKKGEPEYRVLPGGEQEKARDARGAEPEKRILPGGEEEIVPILGK